MDPLYASWMIYSAATAAVFLYVENLPDALARRGVGLSVGPMGWMRGPALMAIVALLAWPFLAASALDWGRRSPTVLTIFLLTGSAWIAGYLLRWLVLRLAFAMLGHLTEADGLALPRAVNRLRTGYAFAVPVLTVWLYLMLPDLWPSGVGDCFSYGYCS